MPIDRTEIRRLAKDPDAIAVIDMIELCFWMMGKPIDAEALIEDG